MNGILLFKNLIFLLLNIFKLFQVLDIIFLEIHCGKQDFKDTENPRVLHKLE
jgi:hypothetical protein